MFRLRLYSHLQATPHYYISAQKLQIQNNYYISAQTLQIQHKCIHWPKYH